jgi:hypothetical protein
MAEKGDGLDSVRLDESAARRLIERATELDAKLASESSIADLRDAARQAGISDEAFQRALAEVRHDEVPSRDEAHFDLQRRQPWRKVAMALLVGLLVGATLLVFRRAVPSPIETEPAVPAAPSIPPVPALPPPR